MATPFKLRSTGPFKMMGSSSPVQQNIFNKNKNKPKKDLADTKVGQGIKKFFSDLKSVSKVDVPREFFKSVDTKLKSVGDNVEKFKAKRRADDIAKNQKKGLSKAEWNSDTSTPYEVGKTSFEVRKEKEARMRKTGKSQYQLDQKKD
jgi:hypothetical protein